MRIGELAKRSGIAAHTIRFYESRGLLPRPERGTNGYRSYNECATRRLNLIQFGQRLGFNLEEIQTTFGSVSKGWDHDLIMDQLATRLKEIKALQQTLTKQEDNLKTIQQRIEEAWNKGDCMSTDELSEIISKTL